MARKLRYHDHGPAAECSESCPYWPKGPTLEEVDPPLVEALRPMIARYGAAGVKRTVELIARG